MKPLVFCRFSAVFSHVLKAFGPLLKAHVALSQGLPELLPPGGDRLHPAGAHAAGGAPWALRGASGGLGGARELCGEPLAQRPGEAPRRPGHGRKHRKPYENPVGNMWNTCGKRMKTIEDLRETIENLEKT